VKIPFAYNYRSVMQRPVSTALTALGIGLVVAVFVAMLALANGFIAALVKTGSSDNVLLLRRGADSELSSGIPRDAISIISASPHIATGTDGRPLVSPETYIVLNIPRAGGDEFAVANVVARGVSDKAFEVRRNIKVIEGRRFASGQSEICVGAKLAGRFANVNVGDVLRFSNRDWNVVCRFTADGMSVPSICVNCSISFRTLPPFGTVIRLLRMPNSTSVASSARSATAAPNTAACSASGMSLLFGVEK